MKQLTCYHVPKQILVVDDSVFFLKSITLNLLSHHAIIQNCSSLDAARYLQGLPLEKNLFSKLAVYTEEEKKENRKINFDVSMIHNIVYDPKRFSSLAILIADYTMPGLNGIELACKTPKQCKRVLLTGDADERIAVEAFNRGIIHRYIKKDSLNIAAMVQTAIDDLEKDFFHTISDDVIEHLKQDQDHPLECFDDRGFNQFIKECFEKYKIVEHYLLDSRGSLLVLDRQANYYVIAVRDSDDMQSAFEIADLADTPVPKEILNALQKKEKLLYFGSINDNALLPSEWKDYLFPVDYVDDEKRFYISFIKNSPLKLDKNKILSFDGYLEFFYATEHRKGD